MVTWEKKKWKKKKWKKWAKYTKLTRNGKTKKKEREVAAASWSWLPKGCNTPGSIDSHQERKWTPLHWLPTERPILQGTEERKASSYEKETVRHCAWSFAGPAQWMLLAAEGEVSESRQTKSRNKEKKCMIKLHRTDKVGFERPSMHQQQQYLSVCLDQGVPICVSAFWVVCYRNLSK